MKYKLNIKKLDFKKLHELGYRENTINVDDDPIIINNVVDFEAIKTLDDIKVAIAISCYEELNHKYFQDISAYRYEGKSGNHKVIETIEPKEYIQDLIECGMVEIIK